MFSRSGHSGHSRLFAKILKVLGPSLSTSIMTGRISTDRNNVNFEEIYGIPIEFFSLVCYEIPCGSLKERNTVMRYRIFERLADQIATARQARGLRRTELAARIGRSPARLTEFERDLTNGRLGKDRLTLLVQICDALDLVPVIVPRQHLHEVETLLGTNSTLPPVSTPPKSVFSEVFVSLSDEDDD